MAKNCDVRVRILPAQPNCFAFGGFEMQMLRTLDAARDRGVDVQKLDIWSREADFDILHVWGLTSSHLRAAEWARLAGKRIMMTPLLPYVTPRNRLRRWKARLIRASAEEELLLALTDLIVVVSDAQATSAHEMYGVPTDKITIIPSVTETPYFDGCPEPSPLFDDKAGYLLCTGNISPRKNQLALARAAAAIGCPTVFIGRVLTGETQYGEEFRQFICDKPAMEWYEWVSTPDLVAAYRNCQAVALASWNETQPGAGLEAAAAGRPLLLGDQPYARQSYFRNAYLVDPSQLHDIKKGLRAVLSGGLRYTPPGDLIAECRPERVGASYRQAYESLCKAKTDGARTRTLSH